MENDFLNDEFASCAKCQSVSLVQKRKSENESSGSSRNSSSFFYLLSCSACLQNRRVWQLSLMPQLHTSLLYTSQRRAWLNLSWKKNTKLKRDNHLVFVFFAGRKRTKLAVTFPVPGCFFFHFQLQFLSFGKASITLWSVGKEVLIYTQECQSFAFIWNLKTKLKHRVWCLLTFPPLKVQKRNFVCMQNCAPTSALVFLFLWTDHSLPFSVQLWAPSSKWTIEFAGNWQNIFQQKETPRNIVWILLI